MPARAWSPSDPETPASSCTDFPCNRRYQNFVPHHTPLNIPSRTAHKPPLMSEFFQLVPHTNDAQQPAARYKHTLLALSADSTAALLATKDAHSHSSSIHSPSLFLLGGGNDLGEPLVSFQRYDLQEEKWHQMPQPLSEPIMAHACVHVHPVAPNEPPSHDHYSSLLLFGGLNRNHEYTNLLWKYQHGKWIDLTLQLNSTLMPSERMSHAMVLQKSCQRVALFGGKTNIGVSNELWFFDLHKNQWEHAITRENSPWPSQRSAHSLTLWKDRYLVLYGGNNEQVLLSDLWIYDLDTQQWEEKQYTGECPPRRTGASNHSAVLYRDYMFTWVSDSLYILDLNDLVWSRVGGMSQGAATPSTSNAYKRVIPEERIGATLALFEDDLFLWGGFRNAGALSDFYMLPLSHVSLLQQKELHQDNGYKSTSERNISNGQSEQDSSALSSMSQRNVPQANGKSTSPPIQSDDHGEDISPIVSLDTKPMLLPKSNFIDDEEEESTETHTSLKSSSLLARHLSTEMWNRLKSLKTPSHGFGLDKVINSGAQNLDSKIGIYAPSAESYITFQELFDPIISDYHEGYHVNSEVFKSNLSLRGVNVDNLDVNRTHVSSVEMRLRRNFSTLPFPAGVNREQRRLVLSQSRNAIEEAQQTHSSVWRGKLHNYISLSDRLREQLTNDELLFDRNNRFLNSAGMYRDWPDARAIFLSVDKRFAAWINSDDSLQLISKRKDGNIQACFEQLVEALSALESNLMFAKDAHRGYLTSDPAHVGTGLTIRVNLHLEYAPKAPSFAHWCQIHHLRVEKGPNTFEYYVSNRSSLRMTEAEIVQSVYEGVCKLIAWDKDLAYDQSRPVESPGHPAAQQQQDQMSDTTDNKQPSFIGDTQISSINGEQQYSPDQKNSSVRVHGNFEEDDEEDLMSRQSQISLHQVNGSAFTDTSHVRSLESELRQSGIPSRAEASMKQANNTLRQSSKTKKSPFELATFYEKQCEKYKVLPNSLIVKQLENGLFCRDGLVDLSENVVGDNGVKPLSEVIVEFGDEVRRIDLSHNGLKNAGVIFLCEKLLSHSSRVNQLNLSKNMISLSGADALIRLVSNNRNVVSINLSSTKVDMKHKLRINSLMERNQFSIEEFDEEQQ